MRAQKVLALKLAPASQGKVYGLSGGARKTPKGAWWRNFSAAAWPSEAAKCAAVNAFSTYPSLTHPLKSVPASAGSSHTWRSHTLPPTAPRGISQHRTAARPYGRPLREQPGLEVLLEGRHVAISGSLMQRNGWRLPPRRGGGDGGGGRSRRHARLRDAFLCRFCLLVLFMVLLVHRF